MDVFTRFTGHYLLHDRGSDSIDQVEKLATIMRTKVGDSEVFKLPQPPYEFKENGSAYESYRWLCSYFIPIIPSGSVIFGFGLGGLLAAALQEDFPARNLSVMAINAPHNEGTVSLGNLVDSRVAIYSSEYPPIVGRTDWLSFALQAYDVPWLQHGINNTKYGLAFLLSSYMQHEDISKDVSGLVNSLPEISKAATVA